MAAYECMHMQVEPAIPRLSTEAKEEREKEDEGREGGWLPSPLLKASTRRLGRGGCCSSDYPYFPIPVGRDGVVGPRKKGDGAGKGKGSSYQSHRNH